MPNDWSEKRLEDIKYDGDEKRRDYCPVHHLKCSEIRQLQTASSHSVPIWVFMSFVSLLTGVLGYINYDGARKHSEVIDSLEKHIDKADIVLGNSSRVLSRVTHSLNEVALNQREVMEKLELEFKHIPKYDNGYRNPN